ncbi:unnamed protein product [Adineta steineri]|uniref:F-box domain-containing protein n=1 Tax=Adineta steineri TaxID=433720 RepID=A0A819SH10_9BILA|nr:unnamed protein product [Adineta steineri]CAF4059405.1 unnamed protein product [Adineta steineri]
MSNTFLRSTIEDLSVELWCEIFEFFDASELYHTFDNINSKITSILSEIPPLYFNIITIRDYNFTSNVILPKVINRTNIKSIKFDQEFQIEEFFTRWSFNTFNQLHCLSLFYLGEMGCDCSCILLEQLSHLTSLDFLHIRVGCIPNHDRSLRRLFQLLFIENDAFPTLKQLVFKCNQDRILHLQIPPTTTMKRTKLELLTLPCLNLKDFVQLLSCIPYIRSIKVNRLYSDLDITIAIPILLSNFILQHCVYLDLTFDYHTTFDDVKLLLQIFPKLNRIKLLCDYILSNGDQWEILLTENCSHLRDFQINFHLQYHFFDRPASTEIENSFSTIFWLNRDVEIKHDHNHNQQLLTSVVRFKKYE